MNNLTSYIFDNICKIDGHIHLFDKKEFLGDFYKSPKNHCVCFGDYSIRHIDEYIGNMKKYYDHFIKTHYNPTHHTLLACAPTIEEMIDIYESNKDVIKGFGEVKIHKIYEGEDYNSLTINDLRRLCKYSSSHDNLPIYVHYTLSGDKYVKNLKNTLSKYPKVPIVLCHCGMEKGCDLDKIFYIVTKLQKDHSNLWVDISYEALNYFKNFPTKLSNLSLDRCIIGSDLNPQIFHSENIEDPKKFCDDCYIDYERTKIYTMGSDNNISKLFKM